MNNINEEKIKIVLELEKYESREEKMKYLDDEIKKYKILLQNFLKRKKVKKDPYRGRIIGIGNIGSYTFPEEDFYNEIIEYLQQTKLSIANNPTSPKATKGQKDKLTQKQQILLIESLGLLANENLKELPISHKAKIFSNILNRGEKSVKDLLTYKDKKDCPPEFFIRKQENIDIVNAILKEVGLENLQIR